MSDTNGVVNRFTAFQKVTSALSTEGDLVIDEHFQSRLLQDDGGNIFLEIGLTEDGFDQFVKIGVDAAVSRTKFAQEFFRQAGVLLTEDKLNHLFGWRERVSIDEFGHYELVEHKGNLPFLVNNARDAFTSKFHQKHPDGFPFQGPPPKKLKFITAAELNEKDIKHETAIKGVLVAGQPCIIGGVKKSMKTTTALDAAVSLASGRPFFGVFGVEKPGKVAIVSAESGDATIKETAKRIAASKGLIFSKLDILFSFEVMKLSQESTIQGLKEFIQENGIRYLILDPAYLLLFAGDTGNRQASNLFDVGSVLWPLTQLGQETGCTVILLHHMTKHAGKDGEEVGLESLSYAGFAEWARQWLLITRRTPYEPGTGHHELMVDVGGSAGHSGRWAVDIDEGVPDETHGERSYAVKVQSAREAHNDAAAKKEQAKAERETEKLSRHRSKLIEALKQFPTGETKNHLAPFTGLSATALNQTIAAMLSDGSIIAVDVMKNGTTYKGFQLRPDNPTSPDNSPDDRDVSGTLRLSSSPLGEEKEGVHTPPPSTSKETWLRGRESNLRHGQSLMDY